MLSIRKLLLTTSLAYIAILFIGLVLIINHNQQVNQAIANQHHIAQINQRIVSLLLLNNETAYSDSPRILIQWNNATDQLLEHIYLINTLNHADHQMLNKLSRMLELLRKDVTRHFSIRLSDIQREQSSFNVSIDLHRLSMQTEQLNQVAQNLIRESTQQTLNLILLLVVILIATTLVILWLTRRFISSPLQAVVKNIENISSGDLSLIQNTPDTEEFELITRQINYTLQKLQKTTVSRNRLELEVEERIKAEQQAIEALHTLKNTQERMLHIEKLSAMGTFVGGLAHEMNNPLMGIANYLEYIDKSLDKDSKAHEMLLRAEEETQRIIRLVKNMLIYARNGAGDNGECDLKNAMDRSLNLLGSRLKKDQIIPTVDLPGNLPTLSISCDALQQILMNVLTNSLDAMEQQTDKKLLIYVEKSPHSVTINVEDNGSGIPDNIRKNVFDPFFTTKPPGKGTGLGLSITSQLINEAGGDISVEASSTGIGIRFRIQLNLTTKQAET